MTALTTEQINHALADTPGWDVSPKQLSRTFSFTDFDDAMDFVEHVATQASEADHHPDILIQYNKVTITLTTHEVDGVTERDIALAKALDIEAL